VTLPDCVPLKHVPRNENKQTNSLTNLTSILTSYSEEIKVLVCQIWVIPLMTRDGEEKEQVSVVSVYEIEKKRLVPIAYRLFKT